MWKTYRKICKVYGDNTVSDRRTQEWFGQFWSAQFITEKVGEILKLEQQREEQKTMEVFYIIHYEGDKYTKGGQSLL